MIKTLFSLFAIALLSGFGFSQGKPAECFYKHYSGILDTNMRLTMDLFSQNGKISGYYFYSFEVAGHPGEYFYGKTIPLTGTLDAGRLIMYEFNNTDSKFTGHMKKDFSISGSWQRRKYEDPISFSLVEDYKIGSIPLICFSKTYEEKVILPDVPVKERPAAQIDLLIIYPEKQNAGGLKTAIDHTITAFMLNDSLFIRDPEMLIENITFDYFESYREATDGVPNIEKSASFNWMKKLTMEVLYNENNLLSLKLNKYGYTGGAHGASIVMHRVFNLMTGQPVELKDLLINDYEEELTRILDKKLRRLNGIGEDENLLQSGFLVDSIAYSNNFYINNDGIGFFYNVYEIAAYATGTTELFCTFFDLKGILRPDHPFFWISN